MLDLWCQKFAHQSEMDKERLTDVLMMTEVRIPASQVLVEHGIQIPTAPGCDGGQALQYYISVVLEGSDAMDEAVFEYWFSLGSSRELSGTD